MILTDWRALIAATITDPAGAARALLALGLSASTLWTGLFLVAVLNAALFALSIILMPPPPEMGLLFHSPTLYLALVTGGLVLSISAIHQVGRILGGGASFSDVMVLIVWLQLLRVGVQALALMIAVLAPSFSAMLVLIAAFYGVFIMVHFINQAHGLNSLLRAVGVLLASGLAILLVLTLVLSLLGASILETSGYV